MTPTSGALAARPAEPALFAGLVDDAAVFPPGSSPLPEAVRMHRVHRESRYAGCVGPLLVPASAAAELVALVRDAPVAVGVIGRPGTAPAEVRRAVELLRDNGMDVAGAELGWVPEWRGARPAGTPLALEVPRGAEQSRALDDLATDASDSSDVRAKFRTGATPTWQWPDEHELATFIRASIDRDLGFKLTGGLHHAIRTTRADDGLQPEHHGLLNVIVAVRWALNGEDADELAPLLAERDTETLVADVTRMSAADAAIVRAFFTAYGCCTVTDPIDELTRLGLIEGA